MACKREPNEIQSSRILILLPAKTANVGIDRRARTAASDKPCMRDKLIARPLHAVVMLVADAFEVSQPSCLACDL